MLIKMTTLLLYSHMDIGKVRIPHFWNTFDNQWEFRWIFTWVFSAGGNNLWDAVLLVHVEPPKHCR